MPSVSAYHPRLTTRQLLVSVQSAAEAEIAFATGVPWVDLKNPAGGSLGQPSQDVSRDFLAVASQYPDSRISIALGEWSELNWDQIPALLSRFGVGKIGLAGQGNQVDQVAGQLNEPYFRTLVGKVVLAIYADWQRADAPEPDQVLELAASIDAPYVLIDTCGKDGRGLLEWMSVEQLLDLRDRAASQGAELVIAGSLRTSDWSALEPLEHVTIGVRGAVCEQASDRTSALSSSRIGEWLSWLSDSPNQSGARASSPAAE